MPITAKEKGVLPALIQKALHTGDPSTNLLKVAGVLYAALVAAGFTDHEMAVALKYISARAPWFVVPNYVRFKLVCGTETALRELRSWVAELPAVPVEPTAELEPEVGPKPLCLVRPEGETA